MDQQQGYCNVFSHRREKKRFADGKSNFRAIIHSVRSLFFLYSDDNDGQKNRGRGRYVRTRVRPPASRLYTYLFLHSMSCEYELVSTSLHCSSLSRLNILRKKTFFADGASFQGQNFCEKNGLHGNRCNLEHRLIRCEFFPHPIRDRSTV